MKIRTGFVTNSSSSSFVISYNENNNLVTSILDATGEETCNIERIYDINDLLDEYCYDSLDEALDKACELIGEIGCCPIYMLDKYVSCQEKCTDAKKCWREYLMKGDKDNE